MNSPQLIVPKVDLINQRVVKDAGADALCLFIANLQMAAAEMKMTLDMADINRLVKEAVKVGALRSSDGGKNSDGWILPGGHEKIAALVGLKNVTKKYVKFDKGEIIERLQWGKPVELRDEGKHSLLAVRWFMDGKKALADVLDPWPKTNDTRLDFDRAMTQREVNGKFVDSRSIEYIGFYEKTGGAT